MDKFGTCLVAVIATNFLIAGISCTCPPDGQKTFTIVPPESYDKTFSSIATDGKRPLGYMKGVYHYNDPEKPNPCVKLENTANKRVEIMIETIPEARICVRDNPAGPNLCGQGNINQCRQTNADSLYFEFFCDGECSESDVTFWYRFALSPNSSVIDPELWCDARDNNEYPTSLLGFIPSAANPKPAGTDKPINGAVPLHSCWLLLTLLYCGLLL